MYQEINAVSSNQIAALMKAHTNSNFAKFIKPSAMLPVFFIAFKSCRKKGTYQQQYLHLFSFFIGCSQPIVYKPYWKSLSYNFKTQLQQVLNFKTIYFNYLKQAFFSTHQFFGKSIFISRKLLLSTESVEEANSLCKSKPNFSWLNSR